MGEAHGFENEENEEQERGVARRDSSAVTPQVVRETRIVERAPGLDALEIIEQRAKLMGRLIEIAVRSTAPEHWTDMDGKPYLTAAGAETVARICGVKVKNVSEPPRREDHHDLNGHYFEYIYRGDFSLPGQHDLVEGVTGSCTSRDQLLGTGGSRMLEDVDPGDIRKKAYTNMLQRGITQLLGLRGLEWPTLAKYGVTPDGAGRVQFKAGAKGGGQSKEFTFPFGKDCKGKTPAEVTDKDLAYYLDAFTKSLADPEKAKFKKANETGLTAVKAEIDRRGKAKTESSAPPTDTKDLDDEKEKVAIRLTEECQAGFDNKAAKKQWLDRNRKAWESVQKEFGAEILKAFNDAPIRG